jgi:hypothetical protein
VRKYRNIKGNLQPKRILKYSEEWIQYRKKRGADSLKVDHCDTDADGFEDSIVRDWRSPALKKLQACTPPAPNTAIPGQVSGLNASGLIPGQVISLTAQTGSTQGQMPSSGSTFYGGYTCDMSNYGLTNVMQFTDEGKGVNNIYPLFATDNTGALLDLVVDGFLKFDRVSRGDGTYRWDISFLDANENNAGIIGTTGTGAEIRITDNTPLANITWTSGWANTNSRYYTSNNYCNNPNDPTDYTTGDYVSINYMTYT